MKRNNIGDCGWSSTRRAGGIDAAVKPLENADVAEHVATG